MALQTIACSQVAIWFARHHHKSENELFWPFYFAYGAAFKVTNASDDATLLPPRQLINDFISGHYQTLPLKKYVFPDETLTVWEFQDRLIQILLLRLIMPTFKHIISPCCHHLPGCHGVKSCNI